MRKLEDVKTIMITGKGQIALPKDIRARKGFREGERIAILTFEDRIELRPFAQLQRVVDFTKPGVKSSFMSERSLGKAWNTPEDEKAWKDL